MIDTRYTLRALRVQVSQLKLMMSGCNHDYLSIANRVCSILFNYVFWGLK